MKTILILMFLIQNLMSPNANEISINYAGFWNSSESSPNSVLQDNSHEILAFEFINTSDNMIWNNKILYKPNLSASYISFNYLNDEVGKLMVNNLLISRIISKLIILEALDMEKEIKFKTIEYRAKRSETLELKRKNLLSKYIT